MGENKWRWWNGGVKHTRMPVGVSLSFKLHRLLVWVPTRKGKPVACCGAKVRCKRWRRTLGVEWPF